MKTPILFIIACGTLLSIRLGASAQTYSLDWSTVDGGGGTSTGGVYSVTVTIGQSDAGAMSGGNLSPRWPGRLYERSLHVVRWSATRRSCQNWKPS
jgi:hypothetical protein